MILNKALIDFLLEEIKKKGRLLDYYLLHNLFDKQEKEIVEELKKYRNPDGGFGHGLEPDTTLPDSSVVCTDLAVEILEEIKKPTLKEELISGIVRFYETSYKETFKGWELVPPEVDNYPHAVWWNYSGVGEFTYGNPNPQVIGFLYQHKKHLKNLDIDKLVNKVVTYIIEVFPQEVQKHNILSSILFYNQMPKAIKSKIHDILKSAVDKELASDHWDQYCLQPYEVFILNKEFIGGHEEILERNLAYHFDRLNQGLIMPNWHWGQYPEVFEKVKMEWAGYLTYNLVKALMA